VTCSACVPQDGEHLLGYPLHARYPAWAADDEVESGEAEAEEVLQLAHHLGGLGEKV
jgi:hypothetical protein